MSAPVEITSNGGKTKLGVPVKQARVPPPSVPKVHYVPPVSGVYSGAWASSGMFLDFEIPKGIGILRSTNLRFDVKNSNSSLVVPPSPFFIQQIEVTIGSTLLETLYPNDIYNETVGFLNASERQAEAGALTTTSFTADAARTIGNAAPFGENFTVAQASNFVAYLPFNNCLTCPGIFCDGLAETIRYRVYFPYQLFDVTTTSLANATLVIEEDVGTVADRKAWEKSSATGAVYSTVVRQRMNTSIQKSSADYTLDLTGINGSSAGYVVYAGPVVQPGTATISYTYQGNSAGTATSSVNPNSLLATRYPLKALELDDQMGNKRTERLYGDFLTSFEWANQVGTNFATTLFGSVYLLAFCANFRDAVMNGVYQGHLWSDSRDRLVITGDFHNTNTAPPPSAETWNFTVTNYQYQALVVRGGKLVDVLKNPHRGIGSLMI